MPVVFGAPGVTPSNRGQPTNIITLQAGNVQLVPSGSWYARAGRYTTVQEYDPNSGAWRSIGGDWPTASMSLLWSDGVNVRIANQTGCVVGALVTTAGSGYTSAPLITPSAGASLWQAIVGGAVSTVVSVTNGGSNYIYPPIVTFTSPNSAGGTGTSLGIQATGFATISGGAVTSITVTDQGAGYPAVPTITLINDPRDATGTNASATATLTGAATVTGLIVTDHGNPLTAIPTLSITGGGGTLAAATAIMCWSLTGVTATTTGSGYSGVYGAIELSALGGFPTTAPAYTNPTTQLNLVRPRKASILAAITAGALSNSGQTVLDGGIYPGTASVIIYAPADAAVDPAGTLTGSFGGITDTVLLFAI
jgi:hypothetical protein